ncbi:MAG: hypothetical protein JXA13_08705 [Anaerolineales bacterium]|nr:hypothetical protein [Anaerolineales bacterium]
MALPALFKPVMKFILWQWFRGLAPKAIVIIMIGAFRPRRYGRNRPGDRWPRWYMPARELASGVSDNCW